MHKQFVESKVLTEDEFWATRKVGSLFDFFKNFVLFNVFIVTDFILAAEITW